MISPCPSFIYLSIYLSIYPLIQVFSPIHPFIHPSISIPHLLRPYGILYKSSIQYHTVISIALALLQYSTVQYSLRYYGQQFPVNWVYPIQIDKLRCRSTNLYHIITCLLYFLLSTVQYSTLLSYRQNMQQIPNPQWKHATLRLDSTASEVLASLAIHYHYSISYVDVMSSSSEAPHICIV